MSRIDATAAGGIRVLAFLDMLAWSEIGPAMLAMPETDDGYRVIVGSTPKHLELCKDYHDHPQLFVHVGEIVSSAAGRYEFLARTWDRLAQQHGYTDFSPANQDLGCIELIRGRGALDYVKTGRIENAINRCCVEWASLPGAGYNQHEQKLGDLIGAYNAALAKYQKPDFSNVQSGSSSTAPTIEGEA